MRNVEDCRHIPALADALWSERHLVEHLLYKLVSAALVLTSGDSRFALRALDEVDAAGARVREVGHRRTRALARVAADWRLTPAELTLARLADQAPEPWRSMLADHRDAFWGLTRDIEAVADQHPRLVPAARRWARTGAGAITLDVVS